VGQKQKKPLDFEPRVIRVKDAHKYLGMDKTTFAKQIRPYLPTIHITNKSRGFERVDIDSVFDVYKHSRCCPPKKPLLTEDDIFQKPLRVSVSTKTPNAGQSTNGSKANAFTSALSTAKRSVTKRNAD
jgi:hypothetical protein